MTVKELIDECKRLSDFPVEIDKIRSLGHNWNNIVFGLFSDPLFAEDNVIPNTNFEDFDKYQYKFVLERYQYGIKTSEYKPIKEAWYNHEGTMSFCYDRILGKSVFYAPLIEKSLGYQIVIESRYGDFSGSSLMLLKKDKLYSILVFGWGSCSGCDSLEYALEETNSLRALEELCEYLYNKIHKLECDSIDEAIKFWEQRDIKALESIESDHNLDFLSKLKEAKSDELNSINNRI